MPKDFDTSFEDRMSARHGSDDWRHKGKRFMRYLSTRQMECWGFFAAGILIGKVIL